MFLPRIGYLSLLTLVACAVSGCSTVYSDTFSNRRSRFVPPPPQRAVLPPEMQALAQPREVGAGSPAVAAPAVAAPGLDGGALPVAPAAGGGGAGGAMIPGL